jgi:hypothetical protein
VPTADPLTTKEWRLCGKHFDYPNVDFWAGKRRMLVPIADIQHEAPGTVSKGRLATLTCRWWTSGIGQRN